MLLKWLISVDTSKVYICGLLIDISRIYTCDYDIWIDKSWESRGLGAVNPNKVESYAEGVVSEHKVTIIYRLINHEKAGVWGHSPQQGGVLCQRYGEWAQSVSEPCRRHGHNLVPLEAIVMWVIARVSQVHAAGRCPHAHAAVPDISFTLSLFVSTTSPRSALHFHLIPSPLNSRTHVLIIRVATQYTA